MVGARELTGLVYLLAPCACVAPVDLGGATSGIGNEAPPRDTALPPVATALTNVVPTIRGDSTRYRPTEMWPLDWTVESPFATPSTDVPGTGRPSTFRAI